MEIPMNARHSLFLVPFIAIALLAAGCSASEEAAKTDDTTSPEFQKTDKQEVVLPTTETPPGSKLEDIQSTEKNVPVVEPKPEAAKDPQPEQQKSVEGQKKGLLMWSVQLGAFKAESGAMQLVTEAKGKFNQPVYKDFDPVSQLYKVTVGSFQTREQASQFKEEVIGKGYAGAFSVEVRR
jgi:cell division septation protein DedD